MSSSSGALAVLSSLGYLVLLALLLLCAIVGGIAMVAPPAFQRLRQWSDRSIHLKRASSAPRPARTLDRFFYRHHKAYGATVLLLAAALLSWLAFARPAEHWLLLASRWEPMGEILVEAGVIFFWVLGLVAIVIGTVMVVRPSALKGIEAWSNRQIHLDAPGQGVNREFSGLDQWLARRPRTWGSVVFCLSLIVFFVLLRHGEQLPGL